MKRVFYTGVWSLVLTLIWTSLSFGAGFQVPEQGVASMGMGMGFIGKADDLSAIYHNPAGLTQLQGTQAYFGLAGISPDATYTRAEFEPQDNEDDLIPVPLLAVSTDFGGRTENFVAAFAVNAPFGLRNEYDAAGPQRYINTKIGLTTMYIGPYVAWQASPRFSIGGGLQYVYATAEIKQKINYGGALYAMALQQAPQMADPSLNENPAYDGDLDIDDATASTFAGNLGILVKPTDNFQIGLSWRSGVDLEIEGDVSLEIPQAVTMLSGGVMQSLEAEGSTTVSLPQIVGVGVSYQPIDQLTVISDFNWINWSVYEDLDFDFEPNTSYFPDKENPRDWDDTMVFRLGVEYWLTEKYALRAGYIYDQTPIPDKSHGPELPTSTRNSLTLGFGCRWEKLSIDLAYAHLFIDDRTVEESVRDPEPLGEYESSGDIFGISVGYAF